MTSRWGKKGGTRKNLVDKGAEFHKCCGYDWLHIPTKVTVSRCVLQTNDRLRLNKSRKMEIAPSKRAVIGASLGVETFQIETGRKRQSKQRIRRLGAATSWKGKRERTEGDRPESQVIITFWKVLKDRLLPAQRPRLAMKEKPRPSHRDMRPRNIQETAVNAREGKSFFLKLYKA